jgi:hypothetical protein
MLPIARRFLTNNPIGPYGLTYSARQDAGRQLHEGDQSMIRNLKVLIAAAMALMAFGALSATAQAAEEKFHCSVEPNCRATLAPDGTAGTTAAHHVFVVKGLTALGAAASASFTCDQLKGEATSAGKTATELTFTNLKYENAAGEAKCKVGASETVTVNFTTCDYKFESKNGGASTAAVNVECSNEAEPIDISIKGTLCLQVKSFASTGLGYKTLGTTPRTVTATAKVALPNAALILQNVGNANCAALGMASTTGAEYTTGNTIVTAETAEGGAAEAWFE